MLKLINASSKASAMQKQLIKNAFSSHALRPTNENGRIKVTDQIVWINVLPPDGVPRRYSGFSGESLL